MVMEGRGKGNNMKQPARLGISILLRNGVLTDSRLIKNIFKGKSPLCKTVSINLHQASLIIK